MLIVWIFIYILNATCFNIQAKEYAALVKSIINDGKIDYDWLSTIFDVDDRRIFFLNLDIDDLQTILLQKQIEGPKVETKDEAYFKKPIPTFKYHFVKCQDSSIKVVIGSKLYQVTQFNILHLAIVFERAELISFLMKKIPEYVLQPSSYGHTVFHIAAMIGNIEILSILYENLPIAYRWILKVKNNSSFHFCEMAAVYNNVELAKFCYDNKLITTSYRNVKAAGDQYHLAALHFSLDYLEYVKQNQPGPLSLNMYGGTVYHTMAVSTVNRDPPECDMWSLCDLLHEYQTPEEIFKNVENDDTDFYGQTYRQVLKDKEVPCVLQTVELFDEYDKTDQIPKKYLENNSLFGYLLADVPSMLETVIIDSRTKLLAKIVDKYPNVLYYRSALDNSLLQLAGQASKTREPNWSKSLVELLRLHSKYNLPIDLSNDKNGLNVVTEFVVFENIEGLEILYNRNLLSFEPDEQGLTPLHYAVIYGKKLSFDFILSRMKDPRLMYFMGWNAVPIFEFSVKSDAISNDIITALAAKDLIACSMPSFIIVNLKSRAKDVLSLNDYALHEFIRNTIHKSIEEVLLIIRQGKVPQFKLDSKITFTYKNHIFDVDQQLRITKSTPSLDMDDLSFDMNLLVISESKGSVKTKTKKSKGKSAKKVETSAINDENLAGETLDSAIKVNDIYSGVYTVNWQKLYDEYGNRYARSEADGDRYYSIDDADQID